MGLIARQLEESGIPTVTMSCARDITAAVNPPRAVFLDYPLGHTAGRIGEPEVGLQIVAEALAGFADANESGWIRDQQLHWAADDSWKDSVLRPTENGATDPDVTDDDRSPRAGTPQYQSSDDASLAQQIHSGHDCLVCKGVDY